MICPKLKLPLDMTEGRDMVVEGVVQYFLIIKYFAHSFALINIFAYLFEIQSFDISSGCLYPCFYAYDTWVGSSCSLTFIPCRALLCSKIKAENMVGICKGVEK